MNSSERSAGVAIGPAVSRWGWRRWLIISAAVVAGLSALILWCNFRLHPGPDRPLVPVDPEVTWITGPLKPNGDPDYVAWLNERDSAGVTAENNAVVDLVRILGPYPDGNSLSSEFHERLGMEPLPAAGDYLVTLQEFLGDRQFSFAGQELSSLYVDGLVADVVLPPGSFPAADEWFSAHRHHFLALRRAIEKPEFFVPYRGPMVVSGSFSFRQETRFAGRSLIQASMLRLGKGDAAAAIGHQLAAWRLGAMIGAGGQGFDWLHGVALQTQAIEAVKQTVCSGQCTATELDRLAAELETGSGPLRVTRAMIEAERALGLDLALTMGRKGAKALATPRFSDGSTEALGELGRGSVLCCDWATVFREMNQVYGRLDLIAAIVDPREKRAAALDDAANLESRRRTLLENVRLRFLGGLTGRGELLADVLIGLTYTAIAQLCQAELRTAAYFELTRTSVALERFRLEQGRYPDGLEQLVPKYLPAVPVDPFTGDPLIYRNPPEQPGLLYSVGPDLVDHGGMTEWDGSLKDSDLLARPTITTVEEWLAANSD